MARPHLSELLWWTGEKDGDAPRPPPAEPWSLTATFAERLRDVLGSLLPGK